jgi:hypothetical protein
MEAKTPDVDVMEYIYPKSYNCPVCTRDFMSFIVKRSKLRVQGRDNDLRTRYYNFDPNLYDVIMCNFCGYASLMAYFENITDKQIEILKKTIAPQFVSREFHIPLSKEDALARYKMAYLCAATINAKASVKAVICLKMAWLCRDMEDTANEIQYLRNALSGLKEAYSSETFPMAGMDQHTAQYTIGELCRRVGEFNEAMRWISALVTARGVPSAIKDKASDIKDLIRDGIST